jgi:hypothetical protein
MSISRDLKRYGSYVVSTATLREEDVGESFLDAMEVVDVPSGRVNHLRHEFADAIARDDLEELGYIVWEEMYDELSDFAPEGFYFGTLEGDGSEFGFWSTDE